jgi:hypothetical protein
MVKHSKSKVGRGSGDIVFKILDTLAEAAWTAPAMIGAILESGYGASGSQLERAASRNMPSFGVGREARRRQYQRYSMMVRYLREQGMLASRSTSEKVKLYLTKKGQQKLARMRLERREGAAGYGYEHSPGKKIVIVTYDIPEKRHSERDWLRGILKRIGLQPMQQSVWIGKVAVPQRLIEDLALRHLTAFVEIVEVGSAGTFQHLV